MQPLDDRELLLAFVASRDVPCPSCGYNLRGLAAEQCPECHQRVSLGVGPVPVISPRQRRLLLGALGLFTAYTAIVAFRWLLWASRNFGVAFTPWRLALTSLSSVLVMTVSVAVPVFCLILLLRLFRLPSERDAAAGLRRCLTMCGWLVGAVGVVGLLRLAING